MPKGHVNLENLVVGQYYSIKAGGVDFYSCDQAIVTSISLYHQGLRVVFKDDEGKEMAFTSYQVDKDSIRFNRCNVKKTFPPCRVRYLEVKKRKDGELSLGTRLLLKPSKGLWIRVDLEIDSVFEYANGKIVR